LFESSSGSTETATNWSGLPIIFDEVFTGLYRLGRRTSASFLGVDADISVHAKLLTGGLIPLAVTIASQEIFDTFLSCEKSDALLHGHSYTAHPIGCHVAETSVRMMMDMENRGDWNSFQKPWQVTSTSSETTRNHVWSYWSLKLIQDLSCAKNVESVFAIGSVFSISLHDEAGQRGEPGPEDPAAKRSQLLISNLGYTSTAAKGLQQKLALGDSGLSRFNVHSRVLGNVLYLMASMKSTPHDLSGIESLLRSALLG
jgi:dethiobiotin synthetase/adenosylmethionine--8-amino-7-oxononanoate aminotransferase